MKLKPIPYVTFYRKIFQNLLQLKSAAQLQINI